MGVVDRAARRLAGCAPLRGFLAVMLIVPTAISVFLLVSINDLTDSKDRFARCVATWAGDYSRRADLLSGVSSENTDATQRWITALGRALDDVIRHDQAAAAVDIPKYQAAYADYLQTLANLSAARQANPIPANPKFSCR